MTELNEATNNLRRIFRDKGWTIEQVPHARTEPRSPRHILKKWAATSPSGVKIERWSRHALLIEVALLELSITQEGEAV